MRMQSQVRLLSGLLGGALLVGCGTKLASEDMPADFAAAPAEALVRGTALVEAETPVRYSQAAKADQPSATPEAAENRKIIYTAEIELAVESFSEIPERVVALVKQFGGYVSGSNLGGETGESRRGSWTVRVPVVQFEQFVDRAKQLGEVVRVSTDSRDVSEEYVDVDARIRNKTQQEARLLKLLEERPGKLEDVVAIERELARVREELERMQGRMRVLEDLTSLTTVQLTIVEIRDYEPAQAPTLATQVRRTWSASLTSMQEAGEAVLLAAVASAPWLPLALFVVLPPAVMARRRFRGKPVDGSKDQAAS